MLSAVGVRPGGSQKRLGVGHSQNSVSVGVTCWAQRAEDDLQDAPAVLLSKQVSKRAGRRAWAHQ